MKTTFKTCPERIEDWVRSQFPKHQVDRVVNDLIDGASEGCRDESWCGRALREIFPEWYDKHLSFVMARISRSTIVGRSDGACFQLVNGQFFGDPLSDAQKDEILALSEESEL